MVGVEGDGRSNGDHYGEEEDQTKGKGGKEDARILENKKTVNTDMVIVSAFVKSPTDVGAWHVHENSPYT